MKKWARTPLSRAKNNKNKWAEWLRRGRGKGIRGPRSFVPVGDTNRDKRRAFYLGWWLQPGQKAHVLPAGPASRWTRDKSHLLFRAQRLSGQMAWNKGLFCSSVCSQELRSFRVELVAEKARPCVPSIWPFHSAVSYIIGSSVCLQRTQERLHDELYYFGTLSRIASCEFWSCKVYMSSKQNCCLCGGVTLIINQALKLEDGMNRRNKDH